MCDQIKEVDTMHIERQDVLTALQRVIISPHLRIKISKCCSLIKLCITAKKLDPNSCHWDRVLSTSALAWLAEMSCTSAQLPWTMLTHCR